MDRVALAIHPGALGDVLLAVPALRALRRAHHAVTLAAQPRIGALLAALGVVDHALDFETLGLDALFADAPLRAEAPLARHLQESTRVVCWFGARDATFVGRVRAFAPDAVIAPPHTHDVVWRHLLHTVGGDAEPESAPIVLSSTLVEEGRLALRAIGWDGAARVLVVHPGAGGVAKRWPIDQFVEVIDGLDATVVLHQGPADADAVHAFTARTRRPCMRLIEPPLPALAGVLASAACYVGNDSGVSHLAAAVGARAVVLFAPATLPWAPWSATARCLTVTMTESDTDDRRRVAAALRDLW